jgi:DNA repair photolyase
MNNSSESRKLKLIPDPHLFKGLSDSEKKNWADYLYANPKPSTYKLNLRNHIIGLYDPFVLRKDFQAGRRWCVNVYVGCAFQCKYCYIISYIRNPFHPRVKKNFEKLMCKDLEEIARLKLHPVPIHISNSTDSLQPLEKKFNHTLLLMNNLQKYSKHFTTITMLTKNPGYLCTNEYLKAAQSLKNFQVEVTCPFYNEDARKFFEPGAPPVENRLDSIRKLRRNNISVILRIDPIFPRNPLPATFGNSDIKDYKILEGQTMADIKRLIEFASDVGCSKIVVSPLKLITGRFGQSELFPMYRKFYAIANNGKLIKKGPAYRLPWELYQFWIEEPKNIAESKNISLVFCKKNLIETL